MNPVITKITSHLSLRTLLTVAVFLVILIIFLLKISSTPTQVVEAGWYNDSWQYRQAINITSHTSAESNVYIIATINIGSTTKAKIDDSDFRFTNYAGQLLPYYISSGVGTTNITFHVFLSSFPVGSQTLYAYYDNLTAPSGATTSDFATQASSYTIGTYSAEETGGAPVGWWKFDEGYGTTANNSGGGGSILNGNFATGSSAPTWVAENNCISGKCLNFNGSTDYLSLTGSPTILDFAGTTPYSIESWVKPTTSNQTSIIFSKYNAGVSGQYFLGLNNGHIYIDREVSPWSITGKTILQANIWYHLAQVYDGTNVTLYVNGISDTNPQAFGSVVSNTSQILIGAEKISNNPSTFFTGYMDDVKIYSYARTSSQILADFNSRGASVAKGNANILGANQQNTQPGYTGPIAYWNFEEGTGTSIYDTSGNNNSGTLGSGNSAPTRFSSRWGKALSFNTNDFATVPDSPSLRPSDITLETWVNFSSFDSNNRSLISKLTGLVPAYNMYLKYIPASGNNLFYFDYKNSTSQSIGSSLVPSLNTWYYLTETYNSSTSTASIYINGILSASTTSGTGPLAYGTDYSLSLGCGTYTTSCVANSFLQGSLDQVKIYNYARTPAQIVQDMNGGHPATNPNSTVAYYKFDEGYGSIAHNSGSAGSSDDGTLGIGSSSPTWTNDGKFGKALSFNGTNNYVDVGSSLDANISGNNNFSISFWFNSADVTVNSYREIAGDHDATAYNQGWDIMLNYPTSGMLIFTSMHNGGTTWDVVYGDDYYPASLNTWYFATITRSGSTYQWYINGKPASAPYTNSASIGNGAFNVQIGTSGGKRFFKGTIDQFKIYNYALTPTDIKNDYNNGQAITLGSFSTNSGSTAPNTAWSQSYCVPGDTTACSPPVGEWSFEEGSGTTAYDSSGNTNNGLLTNSPTWSPGVHGKSLNLNGSSQYISVPHNNSTFDVTSGLTLETWVNLNAVNANNGVFNKGSFANSQGVYNLMLYNWGSGSVPTFRLNGSTTEGAGQLTSATPLTPGKWYHLAATYNQSQMTLYINGVNNTSNNYSTLITTDTNPLILGGYYSSSYTLNGRMDDVRVFNSARTPAQIALDFNHGLPAIWYKFNECQGATVNDAINIGSTGNITIGASGAQTAIGTCNTAGTAWGNGAQGKFGASLNFDGTDDYMTTGSTVPGNLGPTSSFTLSAWVKANSLPSGYGDRRAVIAKIVNTNEFETLIDFPYSGTTKWSLEVGKAGVGSQELNANSAATTGNWNHLVGVFNNGTASLYLNGVYQNSLTYNSTVNSATSSNRGWTVASEDYNGGYSYKFNGQVDDVRIYPYALNTTQIQTIYNEGSAVRFGPTGNP